MADDSGTAGSDLERFRGYLCFLARLQLHRRLQGKVDLSGVVQQTLLEAHQQGDRFHEWDEARQNAWLRKALAHNLGDEIRKLHTAARDVLREQRLEMAVEDSSARVEAWLVAQQSSPSERAVRHEEVVRLEAALAQLPPDQRLAVELHHLRGCPVAEVSAEMGRSPGAVGALLVRGLRKLRELLQEAERG